MTPAPTPMTLPPPPDTTLRTYDPDDPDLQYTGRIDSSNPRLYKFSLNGASITARFKGTAVSVSLKDEFRYAKYRNFYDAIVDGQPLPALSPLALTPYDASVSNADLAPVTQPD